jgi:hypothetical protein
MVLKKDLKSTRFLQFVKDGKYKDKYGKITDTNKKVKNSELDLETMNPPSQKKMACGGLALRGYGRAYMKVKNNDKTLSKRKICC